MGDLRNQVAGLRFVGVQRFACRAYGTRGNTGRPKAVKPVFDSIRLENCIQFLLQGEAVGDAGSIFCEPFIIEQIRAVYRVVAEHFTNNASPAIVSKNGPSDAS